MKRINELFIEGSKGTCSNLSNFFSQVTKRKKTVNFKSFFLILFLLLFVSDIYSQKFECFIISPPAKPLTNVKKIAILNFENFDKNTWYNTYGGGAFVDYLTTSLMDNNRGLYNLSGGMFGSDKEGKSYIKSNGINVFQIVEREQLNNVLREKSLGNNIQLADNQASEIGKVLGIDILILGTIKHTYKTDRTTVTYNDGSIAYCTENVCETEIFLKLVAVENAEIVATKNFKRINSDKACGRDEGKVKVFEQLVERNLKLLALDASFYIAPFYTLLELDFQKIKVKEFKDKAENIKTYLKNADFSSAYTVYKTIYDADNYNAEAAANICRVYLIVGNYDEAAKWAEIAYTIDPKNYGKSLELSKNLQINSQILEDLGVFIEKQDFNSSFNTDVVAEKVKTKGKRSERFEVYAEPNKNSSVVTKVPGDSEFVIIKRVDGFVLIKLLGGNQGYIPNELLK